MCLKKRNEMVLKQIKRHAIYYDHQYQSYELLYKLLYLRMTPIL